MIGFFFSGSFPSASPSPSAMLSLNIAWPAAIVVVGAGGGMMEVVDEEEGETSQVDWNVEVHETEQQLERRGVLVEDDLLGGRGRHAGWRRKVRRTLKFVALDMEDLAVAGLEGDGGGRLGGD